MTDTPARPPVKASKPVFNPKRAHLSKSKRNIARAPTATRSLRGSSKRGV